VYIYCIFFACWLRSILYVCVALTHKKTAGGATHAAIVVATNAVARYKQQGQRPEQQQQQQENLPNQSAQARKPDAESENAAARVDQSILCSIDPLESR